MREMQHLQLVWEEWLQEIRMYSILMDSIEHYEHDVASN